MDILGFGELLIDFSMIGESESGYPILEAHPGGGVANFIAAAATNGVKTGFMGKVGNDAFGRKLKQTFEKLGVDVRGLVLSDNVFTTLAFVTNDETGDRSFSFARKPGADTEMEINDIDEKLVDETKIFHFSTLSLTDEPSKSTTEYIVNVAKNKGKLISFDPNLREMLWKNTEDAKKAMLWGIEMADIVKISDNEIEFLFGTSPYEGAEIITTVYGVKLCAATMGKDGAFLMSGHNRVLINAPLVNPIDTTGAGDICGGTIVSELLKENVCLDSLKSGFQPLSAEMLMRIGNVAVARASRSTEKRGGILEI